MEKGLSALPLATIFITGEVERKYNISKPFSIQKNDKKLVLLIDPMHPNFKNYSC